METVLLERDLSPAVDIIQSGGLVAVPTETVYGLACNGLDGRAVEKVYAVKGRPPVKPLSLLVAGVDALDMYCADAPPGAYALAKKYWPGPLTIILKSKGKEPPIVRAGGQNVGLRCPDHPLTLELLRRCGLPLAAPSANLSGAPPAMSAVEVFSCFKGKIDAVLDGGKSALGEASTVFDMSAAPYRVLRAGALAEEEIWETLRESLTLIGLTGGSGGGKTTALRVLESLGALVIDADKVYHELTRTSVEMREELTARFGAVYDGAALDRKKLGALVFSDGAALADLNAITHKFVHAEIDRLLTEHAKRGGTLAAIDAIALLEGPYAKKTICNVAVTAPREDRIRRLTARDGIGEDAARARLAAQKSDAYFEENCDAVLRNERDRETFEKQCIKFFTEVLNNYHGRKNDQE